MHVTYIYTGTHACIQSHAQIDTHTYTYTYTHTHTHAYKHTNAYTYTNTYACIVRIHRHCLSTDSHAYVLTAVPSNTEWYRAEPDIARAITRAMGADVHAQRAWLTNLRLALLAAGTYIPI